MPRAEADTVKMFAWWFHPAGPAVQGVVLIRINRSVCVPCKGLGCDL